MELGLTASYEDFPLKFILNERGFTSTINNHYPILNLNYFFIVELVVLLILIGFFLIILSGIFWSIKINLSRNLNITYRDQNMSALADLFVIILTPLLIYSFISNSDKQLKLTIIVLALLVLNIFVFVKKESMKKYTILSLTLLFIFSVVFFLSVYFYLKYFVG